MLPQRVLVTGANGLVGRELVARLGVFREYDVLATGSGPPRLGGARASGGYAPLDITDADAVRRLMLDFAPTTVVNCAAMTNVDACELDPPRCWQVNSDAVETLADHCRRTGARLVQVSTDFVFDGLAGALYPETARPSPLSSYARSKHAAENHARGAGLDRWAVARTALVFGMPGTGHDDTDSVSDSASALAGRSNVVLWLLDRLTRGERTSVVTDQWRTPSYAPDVADGLERIVRYGKTGVFHLAGREYLSVYDLGLRVARVFGLDASCLAPTENFRQPAARPPRTGLLILRAESELGYRPRSLDDALRDLGRRLGIPVAAPEP